MTLEVVNQGEEAFLDLLLAINYSLRLFKNDVTSGLTEAQIEALTESSFTVADFPGYANVTLTGGSWTSTPGDPSQATYAQQTFTRNATGTAQAIYGYYVVRSSDSKLMWFEYFPGGPIVVTNNGDAIAVTPRMTLDDQGDTNMFARGVLAREALTANSAGFTVTTDTDLNLDNVSVVAGRLYAVVLDTSFSISAAAQWSLNLKINGTVAGRLGWARSDGSENGHITGRVWWLPSVTASTDDLLVQAEEVSGAATLTLTATATIPRVLTLVDYGLAP